MPGPDLDLLIEAAKEAGRISTKFAKSSADHWDKPDGTGPVTEADLAVNAMLQEMLPAARPEYGWLSEETEDDPARLERDTIFIVDPIDGTRSFIEGSNTWAHALAVAHQGRVTAAVIYLPMRDKMYWAAAGQGAWLNDTKLTVSHCRDLPGAHVLAAKPNYAPENWVTNPPEVRRAYRPSLAYRMACVAEGRFDAMFTLRRSWEWDIAAGDLMIREAGGQVCDRASHGLRFNNVEPLLNGVVAANPDISTAILQALK